MSDASQQVLSHPARSRAHILARIADASAELNELAAEISKLAAELGEEAEQIPLDPIASLADALELAPLRPVQILLDLVSARGAIRTYAELLASFAPNEKAAHEDTPRTRRLVQVYMTKIRSALDAHGLRDALRSHHGQGYSFNPAALAALRVLVEGGAEAASRWRDSRPAQTVSATMKWFDQAKGYGFLTSAELGRDIFVHTALFKAHGVMPPPVDAEIDCEIIEGRLGLQAVRLLNLGLAKPIGSLTKQTPPYVDEESLSGQAGPFEPVALAALHSERGYAFVKRAHGQEAFVHLRTMRLGGVADLSVGDFLMARVAEGPKGPVAVAASPFPG